MSFRIERLKFVGPLYLVSMPGRGRKISHTGGKCVTCSGFSNSRKARKTTLKNKFDNTLTINMWLTQSDELTIRKRKQLMIAVSHKAVYVCKKIQIYLYICIIFLFTVIIQLLVEMIIVGFTSKN